MDYVSCNFTVQMIFQKRTFIWF